MNLQPYEVEFLETASQIPNDLWDACFQPPAEGRWWYETLDQSGIEDQFTFLYGLIKDLGRPIGIAPVRARGQYAQSQGHYRGALRAGI